MKIEAHPKIYTAGSRNVRDIFHGTVQVSEKLDGSQFSFGMIGGELQCRSRGRIITADNVDKNFKEAWDHVQAIKEKLPEDLVFYCECICKLKHNHLTYGRKPLNSLVLFGVLTYSTGRFHSSSLKEYADLLHIDPVKVLYTGNSSIEHARSLIEESMLGGCVAEGVVVKFYGLSGLLTAKIVRDDFKEVSNNTKNTRSPDNAWQLHKESHCTEARWRKSVQHLRDNGSLTESPSDIGPLIVDIKKDIIEEEEDSIKQWLWDKYHKELLEASIQGFPLWYKSNLEIT